MSSALSFSHVPHPTLTPVERVTQVLTRPGFGTHFTDHMASVRWDAEHGWHAATVEPYAPLTLEPATAVLHYGQAVFEGLKAYRQPDGSIAVFRPAANATRFRRSAARMAMPELPEELFMESLSQLISIDSRWVPHKSEESLYLRPFIVATEAGLGVNRPANAYRYLLIGSPAGPYFPGGVRPVSVWLSTEYVRAAPGGTGFAKCAGNYAAAFLAQAQATSEGCDQVVWLDAAERRWVEELGGMNLFFVFGSGAAARVVTPALTDTIVTGITRDSLLTLAGDLGYSVEERRVSVDEWEASAASGELTEVFACGTAAAITPVGRVRHAAGEFAVAGGRPGEITMRLRGELTGIQSGVRSDPYGWMRRMT